jgi:Fe-S cluster biogenesis protein NfuA
MDVYAELQAALNNKSLYALDKKYDLQNYIEFIITEIYPYFKTDHVEVALTTIRKELLKILSMNMTDTEKLAKIKRIVLTQIKPQIEKYLRMEMNIFGEI